MATKEIRRILLDGNPVDVVVEGEELVAGDGRHVAIADATHLQGGVTAWANQVDKTLPVY